MKEYMIKIVEDAVKNAALAALTQDGDVWTNATALFGTYVLIASAWIQWRYSKHERLWHVNVSLGIILLLFF